VQRLELPTVTLCAVTSVNVTATLDALRTSSDQIDFAKSILFTDADILSDRSVNVVQIDRLSSSSAYSDFLLHELVDHIGTSHCLIVQWDGFVVDAAAWDPRFLDFDYIGAPWPQFHDGRTVGNGGFSLRSRRLMEACRTSGFRAEHPEDIAICRTNRRFLEQEHAIRFADEATAERFAYERTLPTGAAFGFHGVFNMIPALGADRFWDIYSRLDDKRTAFVDFGRITRQLGEGRQSLRRRFRFAMDFLVARLTGGA
jgi:hypothetical protein